MLPFFRDTLYDTTLGSRDIATWRFLWRAGVVVVFHPWQIPTLCWKVLYQCWRWCSNTCQSAPTSLCPIMPFFLQTFSPILPSYWRCSYKVVRPDNHKNPATYLGPFLSNSLIGFCKTARESVHPCLFSTKCFVNCFSFYHSLNISAS